MKNKLIKFSFNLLTFSFIFFSIIHLALPVWFDFLISIVVYLLIKEKKLILLNCLSIFFCALIFSYLWGDYKQDEVYFRPHEKWISSKFYKKNIKDFMPNTYGDLYAKMPKDEKKKHYNIKQLRDVYFETDEHGFRNSINLNDADFILVGDSFIVGNGNTQEHIPSEILSRLLNKKVANIAFPGDPNSYEKNLLEFQNEISMQSKIILFYFEGNDFENKDINNNKEERKNKSLNSKFFYKTWIYYNILENTKDIYLAKIYPSNQVFFKLIRRNSYSINQIIFDKLYYFYKKRLLNKEFSKNKKILIKNVNQRSIAFYNNYVPKTRKNKIFFTHIFKNIDILKKIQFVIFIPTKYRVYSDFLGENLSDNLALEFLKNEYEKLYIPVYDITKILKSEIKNENLVYWRDDTHWNYNGINVSMKYIKKIIEEQK